MNPSSSQGPSAVLERIREATNAHDLDALVACFAPEYRNETPAHPSRGFTGREQVRKNWEHIFAAIPDVRTEVLRSAVDGDTVWSEWEHRGTRPDGSQHIMRGVAIFGIDDDMVSWVRFYLEPVEEGGGDVDAFRREQLEGAR